MKSASLALVLLALSPLGLLAQNSPDFSAPGQREVREIQPGKPDDLKGIKPSGVIVMMSENGLQVISPFAPASMGIGKKTLTQNVAREGRIGDETHDRKPFGGIQLIGFEF